MNHKHKKDKQNTVPDRSLGVLRWHTFGKKHSSIDSPERRCTRAESATSIDDLPSDNVLLPSCAIRGRLPRRSPWAPSLGARAARI